MIRYAFRNNTSYCTFFSCQTRNRNIMLYFSLSAGLSPLDPAGVLVSLLGVS
jgi:hypothetical protein